MLIQLTYFPTTQDFFAGVPSTIVLGFKNNGQKTFSFNSIKGTLYYHIDYTYQLENYTKIDFGVPIRSGEEYSFSYTFTLNQMLVEGDYGLELYAFYNDDFGNYSTSFFNSTITLLEPEDTFDLRDVFQLSFVVAVASLLTFGAYNFLIKGKKKSYKTETGTNKDNNDDDWLVGTSADKNKSKAQRR